MYKPFILECDTNKKLYDITIYIKLLDKKKGETVVSLKHTIVARNLRYSFMGLTDHAKFPYSGKSWSEKSRKL